MLLSSSVQPSNSEGAPYPAQLSLNGIKILPLWGYNCLAAKGRTAAQVEQTWNWIKLIGIRLCRISAKLSGPLLQPELPAETPYITLVFPSGIKLVEIWLPKRQTPPDCSGDVLSKMQLSTRKLNWGIHPMGWNVLPIPVHAWTSWPKTFWPQQRCRVDAFQASIVGKQYSYRRKSSSSAYWHCLSWLSSILSDCSAELPCLSICIDWLSLSSDHKSPKILQLVWLWDNNISLGGLILLGKDLLHPVS